MKKLISILLTVVILCSCVSVFSSCKEEEEVTEPMGEGACEYLETRDITGRNIKYVEMCVSGFGRVVILLDATTAPITVNNFISLVKKGFYDGLTFHRIIKNFMIQGGDPNGNGTGAHLDKDGNELNIEGEFESNGHSNDISHLYGVISMAREGDRGNNNHGYNTASCQFFICNDEASSSLDGDYAAFGYVVQGMSVIDAITEECFPKTYLAEFWGDYSIDPYYGTYKHNLWAYYGNGAFEHKEDQPVIKYIKVLDNWSK